MLRLIGFFTFLLKPHISLGSHNIIFQEALAVFQTLHAVFCPSLCHSSWKTVQSHRGVLQYSLQGGGFDFIFPVYFCCLLLFCFYLFSSFILDFI